MGQCGTLTYSLKILQTREKKGKKKRLAVMVEKEWKKHERDGEEKEGEIKDK